MTIGRYLINHPEEAKSTFIAAMVISICWDPMIGTASIEKLFVNRYIVNYTLTSNLQHLASKYVANKLHIQRIKSKMRYLYL